MEKRATKNPPKRFERHKELFADLSPDAISSLASSGSDIVLIISRDGLILDTAFQDLYLSSYGLGHWAGMEWRNTVTVECDEKITALLQECMSSGELRTHQVNHPAKNMRDLPVNYRLFEMPGVEWLVAYGEDLRHQSELQQQVVQAQIELDREYRRIRDTETRYRAAFQKLDTGILILGGEDQKILDANAPAARLLGARGGQLTGQTMRSFLAKKDRERFNRTLGEAVREGSPETFSTLSRDDLAIQMRIDPFRERGNVNCIVQISEHPGDAKPGEKSEATLAHGFGTLPEAFAVIDESGVVSDVNDEFLDMLHTINRENVVGRNINNWIGQSNIESQLLLSRATEEGPVRNFATIVRDEMGGEIPVRISAAVTGGKKNSNIALLITERQPAENQVTVNAGGTATASSDFSELVGRVPLKELIREASEVIEKLCIEAALRQTSNNRASAAEILGLSRQSLYIKLRRYGLESFDGQDK